MEFKIQKASFSKLLKVMTLVIILLGIAVRIIVFLQDRNLFIDEANIARNIFERNFFQLAAPLSYEQYAPPVFMWMLKFFTSLFGYGELAFRLFPLLSAIGAMVVMYFLLRKITSFKSLWYPLGLMAVSYYMIRYSTELKQYMSDVLITLSLLLMALKITMDYRKLRFLFIWFVAGTIAIWSAMPSVFILAGIGVYYFFEALKQRKYDYLSLIVLVGTLWMAQFAVYYFLILKPQIGSEYLQRFHQEYFLFATPANKDEWIHNIDLLKNLLQEAAGFSNFYTIFNCVLLIGGGIIWLIKDTTKSLLLVVPLMLVVIAAALNQYSLIPRVALFIMPLILIVIGYGLEQIMAAKWKVIPVIGLIAGGYGIYCHSIVREIISKPLETEQITDALQFLKQQGISSERDEIYIHNGARPAFIYYTQIHPDKNHWRMLKDAHLLSWDANYPAIAQVPADTIALILTSVYPDDLSNTKATMEAYRKVVAGIEKIGCHAFIYSKKEPEPVKH